MNKVYPYLNNESSASVVVSNSMDIRMTEKPNSDIDQASRLDNTEVTVVESNDSQNAVVIPIKNESNCKVDSSNQVSAFVKFIKSSFSSHKKKSDPNIVINQKLIGTLKNNNEKDNTNSENSDPSVVPSTNSSYDISCRFCQEYEPESEFITPCLCSGTMKYIHQSCLQRWIKTQDNRFCELCKYEFHMKVTTKPIIKWQRLEMTAMERRKIICSVTFHVIALTCVIWSLYVLIERTTEEMRDGRLEWPFWTKLIVVAIGFLGGIVFMYVQCRMYVSLCRKWHAFNRTFIIQSISSTDLIYAQKCVKEKLEHYKTNAPTIFNIYGDTELDNAIGRNMNNEIAQLATLANEDLNNSSVTTPSRPHTNDEYLRTSRPSISLEHGLVNKDPTML